MKPRCDITGCKEAAAWRQYDPVDDDGPVYLCTPHWNEKRILDFDRSLRYGPVRFFTDPPDTAASP